MKRTLYSILLAGSIWVGNSTFSVPVLATTIAQAQDNTDLFYLYKGQRIPLNQRQDTIAVAFKKVAGTRRGANQPLYLQLQKDLKGGLRGANLPKVSAFGENYAVVSLPKGIGDASTVVRQRIQQQPYVQTTLPVLSRSDRQEIIVLPNEIIVSFDPKLSESQRQGILQKQNLAIVRPLRFNRDRYIVKSTAASGTKVLNIANQLHNLQGVTSATPNFIQSLDKENRKTTAGKTIKGDGNPIAQSNISISPKTNLLGLAWHLDSLPLKECLHESPTLDSLDWESLQSCLQNPPASAESTVSRTDIRVKEAWKRSSNKGRGVVVAVIDSLIQWDHPDLADSLYTVKAADKCPGEVHGWDFSGTSDSIDPCEIGDADTRISPSELAIVKTKFQATFLLSGAKLVEQYPEEAQEIKEYNPDYTLEEIANELRENFRHEIAAEFHGTAVSGVIAAQSQQETGLVGVAPNAQILPVRIFGLNGSFSFSAFIEAVGYAGDRGADVINLSLGSSLPSEDEEEVFAATLKAHPKLVIVASAGNSSTSRVGYPAGYKGVVAVGATNIMGNRASYSNYGKGLTVVAPGGDTDTPEFLGGILALGGTWLDAFWQGLPNTNSRWSSELDPRGKYRWVNGTSFSAPVVAGVVALMKGEDPKRLLSRERLVSLLTSTATYEGLSMSKDDTELYSSQQQKGELSSSAKVQQYFFGKGLVNADAAVRAVQRVGGK